MTILVTVMYKQPGYNTDHSTSKVVDTHVAAEQWARDQITIKAGSNGNNVTDIRVILSTIDEEYSVERAWTFKAKAGNKKVSIAPASTSIEI